MRELSSGHVAYLVLLWAVCLIVLVPAQTSQKPADSDAKNSGAPNEKTVVPGKN